jgi:hypothetical protein
MTAPILLGGGRVNGPKITADRTVHTRRKPPTPITSPAIPRTRRRVASDRRGSSREVPATGTELTRFTSPVARPYPASAVHHAGASTTSNVGGSSESARSAFASNGKICDSVSTHSSSR